MIPPGKMIATIRKERGLTQLELARMAHVTKQTISNYEQLKRSPDLDTLEKIADALSIPISTLVSRKEQRAVIDAIYDTESNKPSGIRVPILGTIPAGIPIEAIQDVLDWEELPAEMGKGGKEYFGLRVQGDSMYPRYEDGDIIILRRQETCESGQDCAVMVNTDDATFKRVRVTESGIALLPINPAYEPHFYSNKEVAELPVRILGVVVQLRRDI